MSQLDAGRSTQVKERKLIGQILVDMGVVTQDQVREALVAGWGKDVA